MIIGYLDSWGQELRKSGSADAECRDVDLPSFPLQLVLCIGIASKQAACHEY